MNGVLNFIVSVATTPALLVGLIAMLGLILQKKPATAVIQGSVKTFAGFLVWLEELVSWWGRLRLLPICFNMPFM